MREYVKKIVIIFLVICLIFSTIDISVFQTLAAEVGKTEEQINQTNEEQKEEKENEDSKNKTDENGEEKIDKEENKTEEENKEENLENKEKTESEENQVDEEKAEDNTSNKNEEEVLSNENNEEKLSTEKSSKTSKKTSKMVAKIANGDGDFTYYYEGKEETKTDCDAEELNNVIKEDKGNLTIELNKNIEIEPSYNENKAQASIIFPKSSNEYTIKLNGHTITAKGSEYNIIYAEGVNLTIENGTITGANVKSVWGSNISSSGGVLYSKDCKININKVNLTNNIATNGGAIYCEGNGSLTIKDSTLSNNEVISSGGAIKVEPKSSNKFSVNIENSNINNNKSSSGALFAEGDKNSQGVDVTLKNCTFSGNTSNSGGMGIDLSEHFSLNADNIKVINNGEDDQKNKGAFVLYQGIYRDEITVEIKNSEISGNVNNGGIQSGRSAGLTIEGYLYNITLENTVIKNNTGKSVGGLSINGNSSAKTNEKIKFDMKSGAIFGNNAKEEYEDGIFPNDVLVQNCAEVNIPSIKAMAKSEKSIENHYWNYYNSTDSYKFHSLEQEEDVNFNCTKNNDSIYNVSEYGQRNVAQINDVKYETLRAAIDAVQDNGTIKLIAGDEDGTGIKIPESITCDSNKTFTIDLNGKQWEGGNKATKALTINKNRSNEPKITIKGEGSISSIDFLAGSLTISSKVKIDNLTLGEGMKIIATDDFGFKDIINIEISSKNLEKLDNQDIIIVENKTNGDLEESLNNISKENFSSDTDVKIDENGNIALYKLKGVYFGSKGSDLYLGNEKSKPVKTFEKALKYAKERNVDKIFVVDTIIITENEKWVVPEDIDVVFCRYDKNVGNVVDVKKGGELTLEGVIIDGQKDRANTYYSLIKIDSDATLNIEKGTLIKNNGHSAIDCQGNLNMLSGEISGNNTAEDGAGVFISDFGSMVLDGDAVITNNKASEGGGGIAVEGYGGSLTMNGGAISNNTAGYRRWRNFSWKFKNTTRK